jgi:hypothetical protein
MAVKVDRPTQLHDGDLGMLIDPFAKSARRDFEVGCDFLQGPINGVHIGALLRNA